MSKGKKGRRELSGEQKALVLEKIKEEHLNVDDVKMDRLIGELLNTKIKPNVIAFNLKQGLDPKIIYELRKIVQAN